MNELKPSQINTILHGLRLMKEKFTESLNMLNTISGEKEVELRQYYQENIKECNTLIVDFTNEYNKR